MLKLKKVSNDASGTVPKKTDTGMLEPKENLK